MIIKLDQINESEMNKFRNFFIKHKTKTTSRLMSSKNDMIMINVIIRNFVFSVFK